METPHLSSQFRHSVDQRAIIRDKREAIGEGGRPDMSINLDPLRGSTELEPRNRPRLPTRARRATRAAASDPRPVGTRTAGTAVAPRRPGPRARRRGIRPHAWPVLSRLASAQTAGWGERSRIDCRFGTGPPLPGPIGRPAPAVGPSGDGLPSPAETMRLASVTSACRARCTRGPARAASNGRTGCTSTIWWCIRGWRTPAPPRRFDWLSGARGRGPRGKRIPVTSSLPPPGRPVWLEFPGLQVFEPFRAPVRSRGRSNEAPMTTDPSPQSSDSRWTRAFVP